jgi:acetyl/propionyl-CoA carboxylase alpha subunit
MNKVQVKTGRQVRHGEAIVTITGVRMVERSGAANVTVVTVVDAEGVEYDVSSRSLREIVA